MMLSVEQSVECLAGETDMLGEKTCPSATLSTINPTLPEPGFNPGLRGGKPATNRLSYSMAFRLRYWNLMSFIRIFVLIYPTDDRLCGLVARVLGYRFGGPGSIPGTTRKKK
jgi:hypothetical protein